MPTHGQLNASDLGSRCQYRHNGGVCIRHPPRPGDRAAKKSYLFAFIDDHSRAVMGARWAHHDDVVRMAAAFRPALQPAASRRASTWIMPTRRLCRPDH